ncbi:TPA: hypothetical protein ACSCYS_000356 [Aeromonas veronii]
MSFDLVVIKPCNRSIADLSEVEDVIPLGSKELISTKVTQYFPNAIEGVWLSDEFSVEVFISGEPVISVHITIHFGNGWSKNSEAKLLIMIAAICRSIDASAFSLSDNTKLAP